MVIRLCQAGLWLMMVIMVMILLRRPWPKNDEERVNVDVDVCVFGCYSVIQLLEGTTQCVMMMSTDSESTEQCKTEKEPGQNLKSKSNGAQAKAAVR